MLSSAPAISVGMPVFNGESYVGLTIEAHLRQTNEDFELIICDNASTDGTEDICRQYAARDHRIRFYRNKINIGAARNYNLAFSKASAPFFRWSNADDLVAPELHARCLETLQRMPDATLAYGRTQIIDGEGRITGDYNDDLDLRLSDPAARYMTVISRVGLSNVLYGLIRTSSLSRTALMGPGTYSAADINLIAELALYGKFVELPQVLFYRRFHEDALSWDKKDDERSAQFWNASRKLSCPRWKRHVAEARAVSRAPLSRSEKIRLYRFILRRAYRKKGKFAREFFELTRVSRSFRHN